ERSRNIVTPATARSSQERPPRVTAGLSGHHVKAALTPGKAVLGLRGQGEEQAHDRPAPTARRVTCTSRRAHRRLRPDAPPTDLEGRAEGLPSRVAHHPRQP